ncbi:MAG TPA: acyltransferase family protein [Spirochaetota bacterium]
MDSTVSRKHYLDNLRAFLVILVIMHHAGQAYGPGGAWPVIDGAPVKWLGTFFSINAAFFMGLFFFISGYVMPGAYRKYGTREFMISKIKRLIIPLAVVSFGIFLPINYASGNYPSFGAYLSHLTTSDGVQSIVGHLWFVQHLFIYSVAFASAVWLIRKIRPRPEESSARPVFSPVLLYSVAAALLVFVAFASYAVRMSYPIDRWVVVLKYVRCEPAHLPQYAAFFFLGTAAGRYGVIERIRSFDGRIFGAAAILVIVLRIIFAGRIYSSPLTYAFIESAIAVTVSVGLLSLFRDFLNRMNGVSRFFSDNAYGVYLYHVFPMVGMQMAIAGSKAGGEVKFVGISFMSILMSYTAVWLVRLIPAVRKCV